VQDKPDPKREPTQGREEDMKARIYRTALSVSMLLVVIEALGAPHKFG
jgi:hypothetical protein